MQKAGQYLDFFQIGNEPDFYHDANNATRPAGWGFDDYPPFLTRERLDGGRRCEACRKSHERA
jgi:hypothetical protein